MKITIRLRGYAGTPLHGLDANGEGVWELKDGCTVSDLVDRINFGGEEPALTVVNDEVIRPENRAGHRLANSDVVVILPPLEGG